MSPRQAGPDQVRPNTLRDEMSPITFRGPASGPQVTGPAPAGPPKRAVRLQQIPPWAYLLAVVLVLFLIGFLFNGAP